MNSYDEQFMEILKYGYSEGFQNGFSCCFLCFFLVFIILCFVSFCLWLKFRSRK